MGRTDTQNSLLVKNTHPHSLLHRSRKGCILGSGISGSIGTTIIKTLGGMNRYLINQEHTGLACKK